MRRVRSPSFVIGLVCHAATQIKTLGGSAWLIAA